MDQQNVGLNEHIEMPPIPHFNPIPLPRDLRTTHLDLPSSILFALHSYEVSLAEEKDLCPVVQ